MFLIVVLATLPVAVPFLFITDPGVALRASNAVALAMLAGMGFKLGRYEARYNYENLETGSFWIGHNLSFGSKVTLDLTPMIGGVFGQSNGVAPGYLATLSYRRLTLDAQREYLFDTSDRSGSFFLHLVGTHLFARGMVSGGAGGATNESLPDAARNPAWLPCRIYLQKGRFRRVRFQSRVD